jgi:nucleoside-diphosphate-sugar epimerase
MFSVFGPKQRPDSGIYQFIKSNLKNQLLNVYAEGKILRDYTYVADIVNGMTASANYLIKNADNTEEGFYEQINLGSGSPIDINGVLNIIEKLTGKSYNLSHKKAPVGVLKAAYADISKAKKLLNYSPKMDISKGIDATINWMRTSQN